MQESVYSGGLEIDLGEGQVGGAGLLQPTAPGQQKVLKSSSLGSIHNEDGSAVIVDQDDIIALTTDVKSFSDALAKLKTAFTSGTGTVFYFTLIDPGSLASQGYSSVHRTPEVS